ncbi:hypothetical protein GLOTRDRAFT_141182 [Gloeophyllum trabeum ATCC 11539]|uniref:Fungal-type protein kinase domain-containing protein n=1 Tax=Gloeophyllum trabeum (strain ATCC 11539 / FP-39264 / Madison 617) TaxID=670483 RepID=S7PTE6_GLOTA|nr:uncharacterized protein GLOTRDRAFT_141182 [Gloeophyllum trabeum ATCC 11539]EPQ51026.1 hypothetical protein GLOTRDRAFT_141182 [Gloeophyllum trabeum ATCC 11539]
MRNLARTTPPRDPPSPGAVGPPIPAPFPIPQYAASDSQVEDTPASDAVDTENVDQLRSALRAEMAGGWVTGGAAFVPNVIQPSENEKGFSDMPSDEEVEKFLETYNGFKWTSCHGTPSKGPGDGASASGARTRTSLHPRKASGNRHPAPSSQSPEDSRPPWWTWTCLPNDPDEEAELDKPFETIMNDILKFFGRSTRQAIATHGQQMPHSRDVHATELKTSPDICIIGHGPSITKVQRLPNKPVYTHVAAPIELKHEKDAYEGKQPSLGEWQAEPHTNHKIQLAVYARECFVQQPNRRFVYGLLLTEKYVRLFQFDRAGCLFSGRIHIHRDAHMFVKLILALSTTDEAKLGFDTRIHWEDQDLYFSPKAYNTGERDNMLGR